jgi:methionyl aminopeptidase
VLICCSFLKTVSKKIIIKTQEQIDGIHKSSILAGQTLKEVTPFVKAGVTTKYLNDICNQFMRDNKAIPATLGYRGYPAETCISVNDVICHGIPGPYVLRDGDILNIDVTAILNGYYGDTSSMFTVGETNSYAQTLINVTKECLALGIKQCVAGNRFGFIGNAIEKYATSFGYSVVYEFCGHGVGLKFHEEPEVAHNRTEDLGAIMEPGMIFTIEPMINAGKARAKVDKKDKWTARTIDGKLSAQFEHTICITKTAPLVLTDVSNEWVIPASIF